MSYKKVGLCSNIWPFPLSNREMIHSSIGKLFTLQQSNRERFYPPSDKNLTPTTGKHFPIHQGNGSGSPYNREKFPSPTGKRFPLQQGNVSHSNREPFSFPTRKHYPLQQGIISPFNRETFPPLAAKCPPPPTGKCFLLQHRNISP